MAIIFIRKNVSKDKIVIILLMTLMIILWFVQLYRTTELNFNDADYKRINQEIMLTSKQNNLLQNEILENESLMVIATKAAELGFIQGKFIYIK